MEQYVSEIRIQEWAKIIEAANNSGMPRTEWLEKNNITRDAFYYWNRKVRKYLAERSGISTASEPENRTCNSLVEVPVVSPCESDKRDPVFHPAAVINIGRISIEINDDASASFVENLGRMIHNAL